MGCYLSKENITRNTNSIIKNESEKQENNKDKKNKKEYHTVYRVGRNRFAMLPPR